VTHAPGDTPRPGRQRRFGIVAERTERRMVLLLVLCILLLAVLYVVAVQTSWGQRLDDAALDGRTTRVGVLNATQRLLDTISVASLAAVGVVIAVIAVARRRPHLALMALVVIGGANVTTELLKRQILPRPDLIGEGDRLAGPSFPSGHATVAMSVVVALVLVVPARWRATTAAAGFVYAGLVGMGVVTAGWHRPSDVMGAYLVAVGWGAGAVMLLVLWRGATQLRLGTERMPALSPVVIGIGIALVVVGFIGFATALVAIREDQLDAVDLDETYAAAMAAIVGTGVLLLSALVVAMRGVTLDPLPDGEAAGAPALAT
jgi:membrane-associated phospholipid phosphatase